MDRLGGPGDTVDFRRRLGASATAAAAAAAAAGARVASAHRSRPTRRTAKVAADCEATVKEFGEALALMKRREAAALPKAGVAAGAPLQGLSTPKQTQGDQEQALLLEEAPPAAAVDYQAALIAERGAAVDALTRQIGEVNEIFTDLATLISDQGAMVDDVEANIGAAASRASAARAELARAERAQRAARNRSLLVLGVGGGVLLVLVLVLSS